MSAKAATNWNDSAPIFKKKLTHNVTGLKAPNAEVQKQMEQRRRAIYGRIMAEERTTCPRCLGVGFISCTGGEEQNYRMPTYRSCDMQTENKIDRAHLLRILKRCDSANLQQIEQDVQLAMKYANGEIIDEEVEPEATADNAAVKCSHDSLRSLARVQRPIRWRASAMNILNRKIKPKRRIKFIKRSKKRSKNETSQAAVEVNKQTVAVETAAVDAANAVNQNFEVKPDNVLLVTSGIKAAAAVQQQIQTESLPLPLSVAVAVDKPTKEMDLGDLSTGTQSCCRTNNANEQKRHKLMQKWLKREEEINKILNQLPLNGLTSIVRRRRIDLTDELSQLEELIQKFSEPKFFYAKQQWRSNETEAN